MGDEEKLRAELRRLAIRPRARGADGVSLMGCEVCKRTWVEHLPEEHEPACAARLPPRRGPKNYDACLEELGIPMPKASEATFGRRPIEVSEFVVRTERQMLQRVIPPSRPERDVPDEVCTDEEGCEYVLSWRRLSDEEWEAAQKAYEAALAEWRRTGGRVIAKGATTIEAAFRLEGGGLARAIWNGRAWIVTHASYG